MTISSGLNPSSVVVPLGSYLQMAYVKNFALNLSYVTPNFHLNFIQNSEDVENAKDVKTPIVKTKPFYVKISFKIVLCFDQVHRKIHSCWPRQRKNLRR